MNYFEINQSEVSHCNIDQLADGLLRLRVASISAPRGRFWIEFYGVVYVSAPTGWSDLDFFLASSEECLELVQSLRKENYDPETGEASYKLFRTKSAGIRILAKDARKIIPID